MDVNKTVIVIGGGAAGFFSAITCANAHPGLKVIILEKSGKLLSKVRVSGGGRCNVTHACFEPAELIRNYPRGGRELLGAFHRFSTKETVQWFYSQGVELKTEGDGRMFPITDDSSTIVNCLMHAAESAGVNVRLNSSVLSIRKNINHQFELTLQNDQQVMADAVIIAGGGSPTMKGFDWIASLGHSIIPPVPSLFTFNIPGNAITELMGISMESVRVKITGTKLSNEGPLLITHWGMSGPAILKLSSIAARKLEEMKYEFSIHLSWLMDFSEDEMRIALQKFRLELAKKKIIGSNPFHLPKRLWEFLLSKCIENTDQEWAQLSNDSIGKLARILSADEYSVKGKTTFKEEFVTCGGVSLKEIDFKTMQSKIIPGLYFAGEVLDIDAVTGGFNFQAAWTTGFIAGKSSAESFIANE